MNFLEPLKGYKTYGLALLGAAVVFAQLTNLLDDATATTLLTLLGFGTAAALRNGMK